MWFCIVYALSNAATVINSNPHGLHYKLFTIFSVFVCESTLNLNYR